MENQENRRSSLWQQHTKKNYLQEAEKEPKLDQRIGSPTGGKRVQQRERSSTENTINGAPMLRKNLKK